MSILKVLFYEIHFLAALEKKHLTLCFLRMCSVNPCDLSRPPDLSNMHIKLPGRQWPNLFNIIFTNRL